MLKALSAHHREIARLKFEGYKATEIATRLSLSTSAVNSILKDPLCKAHIDSLNLRADNATLYTRRKMAELQCDAIDRIGEALDKHNETIPWKTVVTTAFGVLDRNGFSPAQKISHTHSFFTLEDLKELQERAAQQGATLSAIDITPMEA